MNSASIMQLRENWASWKRASSLGDFTLWPPAILRPGEFDLQAALQAWEAV